MAYPETPLKGVAKAKYMRDLTRKINCLSENYITNNQKPMKNSVKDAKKKKKLKSELNLKLELKNPQQEYIVQRLKFLKQNIETVNAAVNQSPKSKSTSISRQKFEEIKTQSCKMEKQKLQELYKADIQNFPKIHKPPTNLSSSVTSFPPDYSQLRPTMNSIINDSTFEHDKCVKNQINESKCMDVIPKTNPALPIISIDEHLEEFGRHQNALQVRSNNQLQTLSEDATRALAVPVNKVTNGRRICFRHRRFRQYTTKPFCAHCHDLITEIAYFSGTQQLCFECAERHFERVSQARYRDRPMGYREFKNIGGDTIYNKN